MEQGLSVERWLRHPSELASIVVTTSPQTGSKAVEEGKSIGWLRSEAASFRF